MGAGDTLGPREQGLTLPWCQMLDGPGKERETQETVSAASTHVHEGGVWAWERAGVESHQTTGKGVVSQLIRSTRKRSP